MEEKVYFLNSKGSKLCGILAHPNSNTKEQDIKLSQLIKNSQLEILKGADHRISDPQNQQEVISLMSKFILANCR